MAQKDFTVSENQDRGADKRQNEDWTSHHTTADRFPEEAKGIAETEVKNAHASGDGSYGRNDGSIPEEEPEKPAGDGSY